jgi:ATP-dependent DNA helicase RecG
MITKGTFPLSCFGGAGTNRNHVIASVFRELNLIEERGSGVQRIFREADGQGSPEPQVIEVGMRLRVLVPLAEGIRPVQVTEQVARFVECLKQGPLSTREAMERLALQHRPTFSANYLPPAMNAGLVEMTQPESPRSPTQKYLLIAPAYRSGRTQVEPEGHVMNEATDTDLCKSLLHNCSGVDPDDSRPGHFTAGIQ